MDSRQSLMKRGLDALYLKFDISFLSPDPLECVPRKGRPRDRELSAFLAAAFAYGRADLIVKNVRYMLDELGPRPYDTLMSGGYRKKLKNFKYRFHKRDDVVWLLGKLEAIYGEFGSLENAFAASAGGTGERLASFAGLFADKGKLPQQRSFLVPSPASGSACKRMNLFLRWMVRKDGVDMGIWKKVKPSELLIPMDVHVHRIANRVGLVSPGTASFKKAVELTENLKVYDPDDPVRYDFALCSLGKLGHCLKRPDPESCMRCVLSGFCEKAD